MLVTIQCRVPVYVQVDTDELKVERVVVDDEHLERVDLADLLDEIGDPLADQHGKTAELALAVYDDELDAIGDLTDEEAAREIPAWPAWQFGW